MSGKKFCWLLNEAKIGKNDRVWFPRWVRRYASMGESVGGQETAHNPCGWSGDRPQPSVGGQETAHNPGQETAHNPGQETAHNPGQETAHNTGRETIRNTGNLSVTEGEVIRFLRTLRDNGTPAWQRLQAVRAVEFYRNLVLKTELPVLHEIRQTLGRLAARERTFAEQKATLATWLAASIRRSQRFCSKCGGSCGMQNLCCETFGRAM